MKFSISSFYILSFCRKWYHKLCKISKDHGDLLVSQDFQDPQAHLVTMVRRERREKLERPDHEDCEDKWVLLVINTLRIANLSIVMEFIS